MPSYWDLGFDLNGSFMLGEESLKTTEPSLKKLHSWRIALNGRVHPAVCEVCGRVLRRDRVYPGFILRRKYDLSSTLDGYLIASENAKSFFEERHQGGVECVSLPGTPGFFWLDYSGLPTMEVDVDESKIRLRNPCERCGSYSEVLFGLRPGTPPTAVPLVFKGDSSTSRDGLFKTDVEFGSTHELAPALVAFGDTGEALKHAGLTGLHVRAITA
jgi:hypothetical protein